MKHKKIIVWFRNDLRLKDNVTLQKAAELGEEVIPVYCFDSRHFQETPWGFQKTGQHRASFLLETVSDLKFQIDSQGGQLVVFSGLPEVEVVELAQEQKADAIFFSQEVTAEELNVEQQLEKNAWSKGIATESFWQSTLYHLDDLNFPVQQLPDVFTNFRKSCEKMSQVRATVSTEVNFANLQAGPIQYLSRIPSLKELGFDEEKKSHDKEIRFTGGESAAEERLNHYFWNTGVLSQYKKTRNELLGIDFSSNWGNWIYIAGVGNDSRHDRYFNILLQAKKYDSKGDYVRHWIPELAALTNYDAHQPFHLDQDTLKKAKIKLGKQYPSPMVSFENWSV